MDGFRRIIFVFAGVFTIAVTVDCNIEENILLLPTDQKCSPFKGTCKKGDLLDPSIADCSFHRKHALHPLTCSAKGSGGVISWVVGPDKHQMCRPKEQDVKLVCGSHGTNTRCVCSDYKFQANTCRCQYWTEATPGEDKPGFCTAHYLGGDTGVHHYACCNNCGSNIESKSLPAIGKNDVDCDGVTYQGGSSGSYCGHCGKPLGGGELKWYFNCVNCSVQETCRKECDKAVSTVVGLCWKWVNCFKGCCTKMSRSKFQSERSSTELKEELLEEPVDVAGGFCGDLSCSGAETVESCPSDCCPKINNATCSEKECSPMCCLKDDCCNY